MSFAFDGSGTTALATTGTGNVQVAPAGRTTAVFQFMRVFNAGAGDFFISLDGGTTWAFYIPAAPTGGTYETVLPIRGLVDATQVYVKRAASTNVASTYITIY